jgi:hypothetical protein
MEESRAGNHPEPIRLCDQDLCAECGRAVGDEWVLYRQKPDDPQSLLKHFGGIVKAGLAEPRPGVVGREPPVVFCSKAELKPHTGQIAGRDREGLGRGSTRLATSPAPTGSALFVMTMGIVRVACLAAWVAGVPDVTITSALSPISSAARRGRRSGFPSPNRDSKATFCPSR